MSYKRKTEPSNIDKLIESQQSTVTRLINHQQQQQQAMMNQFLMQQETVNHLVKNQQIQLQTITHILDQQQQLIQHLQQPQQLQIELPQPQHKQQRQQHYQHSSVSRRNKGIVVNENGNTRHQDGILPHGFGIHETDQEPQLHANNDTLDNVGLDNEVPRPTAPSKGIGLDETPQLLINMRRTSGDLETRPYDTLGSTKGNQNEDTEGKDNHYDDDNYTDSNMIRSIVPALHHQHHQQQVTENQRDIMPPLVQGKENLTAQRISNIQRQHTLAKLLGNENLKKGAVMVIGTAKKLVLHMMDRFDASRDTEWKLLDAPLQMYGQNTLELELDKHDIRIIRCHDQWFAKQTMEQVWNYILLLQRQQRAHTQGNSAKGGDDSLVIHQISFNSNSTPIEAPKIRKMQAKKSVTKSKPTAIPTPTVIPTPTPTTAPPSPIPSFSSTESGKRKRRPSTSKAAPPPTQRWRPQPPAVPEL